MRARLSQSADVLTTAAVRDAQPRTQAEILEGVARGQRWANAALYDALKPVVVRVLQKILRDPAADYEDLVQTTFERIVRTLLQKGVTSISNLAGWAGAIAAHVALDALRVRIRERKLFSRDEQTRHRADDSVIGPNLELRLEARRQLLWVQEALARMNPDQAETLLLHDVLGHDLVEAAGITGVGVAAAQKRLSRAREELLRRAKRRAPKAP